MINGRRVLALIPARSGSKGLPGKNARPLCGKPLIVWTIEVALKSRRIDCVLVSTDSDEIANIARSAGAYVPFLRPAHLAGDASPTLQVVVHAHDFLKDKGTPDFDYLVLLEPTSPLREDDDIDKMIDLLDARSDQFDSIISVGEVGEHPAAMKRLVGESMEPYCPDLPKTTRRQDNEPAYFPYGVAYIAKMEQLLAEQTFYTGRSMHYRIQRYQNYEIDDLYDFLAVQSVLDHKRSCK